MFLFFKQNAAYEMRISDGSSDVCSSDLPLRFNTAPGAARAFLYAGRKGGREYEPGALRWMTHAARRGIVVADVGAHVGYYSPILAAAGAVVVAFEMHPDLLLEIRRNLPPNRLDRPHVTHALVCDHHATNFHLRSAPPPAHRGPYNHTAP